jgi:hypothetical protein
MPLFNNDDLDLIEQKGLTPRHGDVVNLMNFINDRIVYTNIRNAVLVSITSRSIDDIDINQKCYHLIG